MKEERLSASGSVHQQPRMSCRISPPGPAPPSHEAIGFYHHCEEDIVLYADPGFKCFRTSIQRRRLFPTGKETVPSEAGLVFCDRFSDCCRKQGIEPLAAISHYELPYVLTEKCNGLESRKVVALFEYCRSLFSELS